MLILDNQIKANYVDKINYLEELTNFCVV